MRTILTMAAVATMMMGAHVAAQDQTVYKIGEQVKAPVLIREVKPKYTEGAMRRRVEGTVELSVVVLRDGSVGEMSVLRSLDAELDEQAMAATREWKFKPGTKDGEPVNVQVNVELTFTLKK